MAKGVVSQRPDGGCRVEFAHKGYMHGIEPAWTEGEGRIICDLLAVKEAVDAAQPLDSLTLHTADQVPSDRLTYSAAAIVRSLSFVDALLQLGRVAEGTNELEDDYEGASHLDALGIAAHKLLCVAAYMQHLCAVQLLLLLHPAAASQPDGFNWFATHSAAAGGSVPVLRLLLAAAPHTVLAQETADKYTPLSKALWRGNSEAATYLIGATPAYPALDTLLWYLANQVWQTDAYLHFATCVIAHSPLPDRLWAKVPAPCAGLAHALPAALQHSHAQARKLVQHLPPADGAVLHVALLSLARQQRTYGVALPPLLVERILCMAYA